MATTNHILSLILTLISNFFIIQSIAGITLDLIHRDSPRSPLSSNSPTSHVDKYDSFINRSISRARYLTRAFPSEVDTIVAPIGDGEYMIELGIGTPPTQIFGVLSTASDLTWTQCLPCVKCFPQNMLPIFDPKKSTSYKPVSCELTKPSRKCIQKYKYNYPDKSFSMGDVATDTLTFGPEFSSPVENFTFGCGHENQVRFHSPGTGFVGLGQGPNSLVSQTKHIPEFDGHFSYCLVPYTGKFDESVSNKITFGHNSVIPTASDVVSTPMFSGHNPNLYYIILLGVSIGNKIISFPKQYNPNTTVNGEGNTVIDSGTALTFLPGPMLDAMVTELRKEIKLEPISNPTGNLNKLCYVYRDDIQVPTITFQFAGGDLGLVRINTFVKVPGGNYCLAMLPVNGLGAIYGTIAQQDYVVGYDLVAKKIKFKATNCTTYGQDG